MNTKIWLRKYFGQSVARYAPYGLYGLLEETLADCDSILDMGCGPGSILQYFAHGRFVVGADRYFPSLRRIRDPGPFSGRVAMDVMNPSFRSKSFDAVVCLDLIEHLEKKEGFKLLKLMSTLARKRMVIFTPNGFLPQSADQNPWQEHRSGWTVNDFQTLGFQVHGIYGWKKLRRDYSRLKWGPWWFWETISFASHILTSNRPEQAFSLCAVKPVDAF